MINTTIVPCIARFSDPPTTVLQSLLLLACRLVWGVQFAITGWGKLHSLDKVTDFFTELGIPFAKANALIAGSTECFGGALLAIGLASRFVSMPLIFTMLVAYATADKDALHAVFTDFDEFTKAAPFPFLMATLVAFCFGPGKFSIDHLIGRGLAGRQS